MRSNLHRLTSLFACLTLSEPCFAASVSLIVSDEVSGNNATGRALSESLDDIWSSAYPSGAFRPDLFSTGAGYSGSKSFTDPLSNAYQVDWQFGYINDVGPGFPTSSTFINASSGNVIYGASNSIQSGAPNPYNSETRVSTGFSGSGLNGIKLDFNASTTDILEFGIYVGDLETRSNNGTTGRVIVFDKAGAIIDDLPIENTGTVLSSGGTTTYTPVEPLGSPSGNNNNPLSQWGNKTTVFLAISSIEAIGSVIIHVGDDDHTSNHTGTQEQLGLVGFSLPSEPILAPAPSLSLEKVADNAGPFTTGDVVSYTYTVTNDGNQTIRNVAITDTHNGSGPAPIPQNESLVTDAAPLGDSTDLSQDNSWDVLAPGDVITFTGTYTVTQMDVDNLN